MRRLSVSEAIRPLLGKPNLILFLSTDFNSTFPLTTVTGDDDEHLTMNLTVDDECNENGQGRKCVVVVVHW